MGVLFGKDYGNDYGNCIFQKTKDALRCVWDIYLL